MKVGSIVEYIGGNDAGGEAIFKLLKDTPYIVESILMGRFDNGIREAIRIDAAPPSIVFCIKMFKEVQPPMDISILLEKVETCTI